MELVDAIYIVKTYHFCDTNSTLGNKCSVGSNPTLSNQGDGANVLINQEDAPIT